MFQVFVSLISCLSWWLVIVFSKANFLIGNGTLVYTPIIRQVLAILVVIMIETQKYKNYNPYKNSTADKQVQKSKSFAYPIIGYQ